jgi:hypothetical protein
MNIKQEISDRKFRIWSYTVSHNILIIRSPLSYKDADNFNPLLSYNIDIEFIGVTYLDIPTRLNGFEIKEAEKNIPDKILDQFNLTGGRIFEIISETKRYYIIAGGFCIGKNKWITEDRISNMDLQYDEVLTVYP